MGGDGPGLQARQALASIVGRLPGGERRDAQLDMCEAVAEALAGGQHLVVEAGTGVGKSLAYLVPAVLSGQRVVIATARKPLQDQLIRKDIPFVATALPAARDAAVLKGRSNYLCLAKLAEATGGGGQGQLVLDSRRPTLLELASWAETAGAGDLADSPVPVDRGLRALITVGTTECPGARSCAHGEACLAERALDRAREAQLVVTNMDLYCLDAAIGGGLLGEHDAVVFDEAHELEAIATRTFGVEIGRRRFGWLAGQLRGLLVGGSDEPVRLERAGDRLAAAFAPVAGHRVDVTDDSIAPVIAASDEVVSGVVEVLRKLPADEHRDGRRDRCLQAASHLLEDVRAARAPREGEVAWVPEGDDAVLNLAPVDVGPVLARLVFGKRTAVLTSATLSVGGTVAPLANRVGLRAELLDADGPPRRELRVGSPFDYRAQALLYCPVHLPDPRQMPKSFDTAALEELSRLVEAARGRTLALFTSHRMLRLAAETLEDRFPWPVLVQDGPPEPGLIERFRDDEQSCLLATMGYWQGVDVPGRSLSLVVIDRLPFASPRDPLLEARREAARDAGHDPFDTVDLPLAATLLAQGAGRLVRSGTDRGVVAVLDRRLAKARYRNALLDALPSMRRTIDGDEVRSYLAAIADGRVPTPVDRRPRRLPSSAPQPMPAQVGLELTLTARGTGRVVELLGHGAVLELTGGGIALVPWGEVVAQAGRDVVLGAPQSTA
ncbi:MAG: ATP-dependent DNA helicase [Actinomycetota bacterium]|nr:ATP-dependent DNA helicase [Actinomycetota bacterium]